MGKSQSPNSLLLLAIGAAAGIVAGAVLVDRVGGLDRVLSRARRSISGGGESGSGTDEVIEPYGLHDSDGGWEDEDDFDASYDDDDSIDDTYETDDELSPESMAHVHASSRVRGGTTSRGGTTAGSAPDVLTLEARVLEAFHNDPVLRERAIDIGAIAEGVIELTGWVHADSEVAHAVTIAGGVPDVHHVVDQLSVRQPARSRRATDPRPLSFSDLKVPDSPPRAD